MRNEKLNRQYQRIKDLIKRTQEFTNENIELQSHWGRYLCVLASGFIENAISEIYMDVVQKGASPHVARYANKTLDKI